MRILHLNLAKRGIGRYGLLYGQALGTSPAVTALSVFDEALFDEAPVLAERAATFACERIDWDGERKDRSLRRLLRLVRAFRPDVIHDSAGSYTRSLMLWPLLRRHGRLVVTEHDPVSQIGIGPTWGEHAARRVLDWATTHLFVHGGSCRQALIDRGIAPEKVTSIRHGHLGALFDREAYTDTVRDEHEVLFFGELRPNKGADWLYEIGTAVHAACPEARFVVAGSVKGIDARNPEWGTQMGAELDKMRAHPAFEIHDRFIPDEEVEFIFRRSGFTLMPYRGATQSGVAMVAMPFGSVVVSTAVGDIPEVVQDGRTGYLAPPRPEAVAERLIYALRHPEETRRIRDQARHFALTDCAWTRVVETVVAAVDRA